MEVTVRLFGPQARAAGRRDVVLRVGDEAPSCAGLRTLLAETEPGLKALLPYCRFAVNHEFAPEDRRVGAGDEVALIGMVSGG